MGFDLDNEELKETREKLGLQGKCKDCLGCELINTFGFKGRKKCKYYIKAEENDMKFIFGILLIEVLLYILFLGYFYTRFNMLCGG